MLDRKAYEKLDYTLCLLSVRADGTTGGYIINSLHQVASSFPAKFTISVNRVNATTELVEKAGSFCVTLLAYDAPESIIQDIGYRSGRVADKFAGYSPKTDAAGNPYLSEHMVSRVSCRVLDKVEVGNYTVYVAQATEAEVFSAAPILTLNAFTGRGHATPSTATVYREMVGGSFRCSVCGYVYESETLREDFICPICRATADKFIRQD